jgi:hypothetical protein
MKTMLKQLSTMKTNPKSLMALIAVLLLSPFMLAAQSITETKETPPFTGVNVSGVFTLNLTQGDAFLVQAEAPQNQLDHIDIRVAANMLMIEYKGRDRNLEKMTINVTAPLYESINSSGASSVRGMNQLTSPALIVTGSGASNFNLDVSTELLTTKMSGASNAVYSGRATRHELNASGACIIRASGLETEATIAELSGASNASVTASAILSANASGTSRLSYLGNPLQKEIKTSGMAVITATNGSRESATRLEQDTFIVSLGKHEVRVADGGTVSVRSRRLYKFRDNWTGLEMGINGYLSPGNNLTLDPDAEFMDVRYNRSLAVNLNLFQQNLILARNTLALVTGIGVGWNNYYFNEDILLRQGSGGVEHEVSSGQEFKRNKLTVSHLNVPLLLEVQSPINYGPNAFHLSAGINVGLRLRSHTKQVYFINGEKNKDKNFDHFHLNPFRYDATARIGWGRLNLFASYTLNSMFKDGKGPELTPFTVGVRVISF